MEKILNSVGIILTILGTILTLWTTFATSIKDAGTYGEIGGRHEEFPKEKRRVILGCLVITTGGIIQIISQFI